MWPRATRSRPATNTRSSVPDKIAAAGHPKTTVLIVTEPADHQNLSFHTNIDVQHGQTPVAVLD